MTILPFLQSSCVIDVEFFPYDIQTCRLKLGSWTYDGLQVTSDSVCSSTSPSSSTPQLTLMKSHHLLTIPRRPHSNLKLSLKAPG